MQLKPHTHDEVEEILKPEMANETTRMARVKDAFFDQPGLIAQIVWSGSAYDFTIHLIDVCVRYGKTSRNEQALTTLLKEIAKYTGDRNQQRIKNVCIDIEHQAQESTRPMYESSQAYPAQKKAAPQPAPERYPHRTPNVTTGSHRAVDMTTRIGGVVLVLVMVALVGVLVLPALSNRGENEPSPRATATQRLYMADSEPNEGTAAPTAAPTLTPNALSFANEAEAAYRAGELAEAVRMYNEAIKRDEDNVSYYVGRGVALMAQQRYSAATDDFERALELQPNSNEIEALLEQARSGGS